MISLAFAAALGFGLVHLMEIRASCADCESDNLPGIRRAFNAFYEQCSKVQTVGEEPRDACFTPNLYNKVLPIVKALGKDHRFGPGERILAVGDVQEGQLTAGVNRGYQTAAPLDRNIVTIRFTRINGQYAAIVKICAVSEDGSMKRVGTINLAEPDASRESAATVSGIRGKILRIDISGSGSPGKKLNYRLTTS